MVKTFKPLSFGNNYKQTLEYKEMWSYLQYHADAKDLAKIYDGIFDVPVEMAWSGKNKRHETIQEHYWIWRKGTPQIEIEEFFLIYHLQRGLIAHLITLKNA